MKKLLITGFEPFGPDSINPSWEAVKLLPTEINGYALTKMQLPVVFSKAAEMVISAAKESNPDVILCIGLAGGRAAINPELLGINLRHGAAPDNNGYKATYEKIIEDGAAAYFSTLPVQKIAEAINKQGIPSHPSHSAGTYICNDVLYSLLHHFNNTATKVGFIHVPYSDNLKKEPSMEMSQIVKALTTAIENIDD